MREFRARECSYRWLLVYLIGSAAAFRGAAAGDSTTQSTAAGAAETRSRINRLLTPHEQNARIALVAENLRSGRTWVSRLPHVPLKPASVLKLFVTAAALERFGPDFAFETRLYLLGNELLVLGGGDPGLGDERIAQRAGRPRHQVFNEWAARLHERGVTDLEKIAIDDSIFESTFRHPDWPDDQAGAWYQAPVGGINFNDNCLDASVVLTDGAVTLQLQPPLPDSFIRNALAAGDRHAPVARRARDADIFEFLGPVSANHTFPPVSAGRPIVFFGHALAHALDSRGIQVSSVVRREVTEELRARAELLAVHSTALRDVLWRANTHSQNLFAECLLKSLSAYNPDGKRSGQPGGWDSGRVVLKRTLEQLGVDTKPAVFRDGSGLSHTNRVTAAQVVQLLRAMRGHPHAAVYLDSLARPGRGSMRRYYDDPVLRERLRGKTGTIAGVRALAGYVTRDADTTLVFALLINGDAPPDLPAQVCRVLAGAEQAP